MSTRRIREFLDGNQVKYAVISHSPAFTAQEVAASAHIPGRDLAKTVVVNIGGRLALAVVPASRMVDMDQLRTASGAEYTALADESDFARRFEGCQVGTAPPFGVLFGMETYVEKDLAKEEMIAFNAGTHSEVVAMRFADFRRLVHPKLAHISLVEAAAAR
jgi:Ala-tRNA(Pro) deacylase